MGMIRIGGYKLHHTMWLLLVVLIISLNSECYAQENTNVTGHKGNTIPITIINTTNGSPTSQPIILTISDRNDWTWLNIILTPITAGAAAYFTYLLSHRIEDRKDRKTRTEERDFHDHIKKLIRLELSDHLEFFKSLDFTPRDDGSGQKYLVIDTCSLENKLTSMETLPKSYSGLSTETKAKVFTPEILEAIEMAYRGFNHFGIQAKDELRLAQRKLEGKVQIPEIMLTECQDKISKARDLILTKSS
jgi:hypothetical protein